MTDPGHIDFGVLSWILYISSVFSYVLPLFEDFYPSLSIPPGPCTLSSSQMAEHPAVLKALQALYVTKLLERQV